MISKIELHNVFNQIPSLKVAVVGDVMLDSYYFGNVDRISPEAPVPIVSINKKELRIGGAGNVALNIAALGAKVDVLSVVGQDDEADKLFDLFEENNIKTDYCIESAERITTNKIRIVGRNQQMMRLDAENTHYLSAAEEETFLEECNQYVAAHKPDVLILEDYNKGVLSENVIQQLIALCRKNHILTAVDPKKNNFFAYKHVNIFKPNFGEAKTGLNLNEPYSPLLIQQMHEALHNKLQHDISLITLSEKGIFYQHKDEHKIIPTHVRTIADVSGAGDTVIAVAALVYAASKNAQLMAEIANIAGGLVCEQVGTAVIDKQQLLQECAQLLT
jgi:D-glycero-beta-D-manno-heptose-7-phosphate kinase